VSLAAADQRSSAGGEGSLRGTVERIYVLGFGFLYACQGFLFFSFTVGRGQYYAMLTSELYRPFTDFCCLFSGNYRVIKSPPGIIFHAVTVGDFSGFRISCIAVRHRDAFLVIRP